MGMGTETETKKKKKKRVKIWVALYLAALVVLYLIIYAFPAVTGILTPTMVISYGELKVWDDVSCYLIRSEQVYTAEKGGTTTYYVPEGTMSRKGTKVMDVAPASGGALKAYSCEQNGAVSYYIDGNEAYFTPETMTALTEEGAEEHGKNPENTIRLSVLAGEPIYKLFDPDHWYAVYWVGEDQIGKYQKDNSVTIELPMGSVKGSIYHIAASGEKWMIVLKFDRYYEDLAKVRTTTATVITEDYSGLLIPNESLVTVEGKLGVYVKNISGGYDFVRVKVITTDGESSLVKDTYFNEETDEGSVKVPTVEIYDEILKSGKP